MASGICFLKGHEPVHISYQTVLVKIERISAMAIKLITHSTHSVVSFPANNNYFNLFLCFLGHVIFEFFWTVQARTFKLCFCFFSRPLWSCLEALTVAVARLLVYRVGRSIPLVER